MNKNRILVALLIAVFTVFTANAVMAYRGDPSKIGPNYAPERHEAMIKAFQNQDYAAWKDIMNGRGRVSGVINQGNFDKFVRAHDLALEGRIDEANAIRKELGLGQGSGQGSGCGRSNDSATGRGMGLQWSQ